MERKWKSRFRKLLMESMEHRVLLAADLFTDSIPASGDAEVEYCTEWTEVSGGDSSSHEQSMADRSPEPLSQVGGPSDPDFGIQSPSDGKESIVSLNSLAVPASVVDSFAWYSGFESSGGVLGSKDTGKKLVKQGAELQTVAFENLLSNSGGITGLAFTIANLPSESLSTGDFLFQMSPQGDFDPALSPPENWENAPLPVAIEVGQANENSERLVSLRWADNAIENRWVRLSILSNVNTGFSETEVYFIGHLTGKVQDKVANGVRGEDLSFFEVGVADAQKVLASVGMLSTPGMPEDVNKNGVVSFKDISDFRANFGSRLTIINIPPAGAVAAAPQFSKPDTADKSDGSTPPISVMNEVSATVVGAFVYHRNSGLAGNGMTHALDNVKQLARESTEPQTLGMANMINSSRGVNGLVFDISLLPGESLSETDFVFQVSPTGAFNELNSPAMNWELAPTPEMISVTQDQQTNLSRVSIHWPDNSIVNRWLRVTILANANTGLGANEVYYIGHLQGKSTDWMINFGGLNPSGIFEVHRVDILAIRDQIGQTVDAGSLYDVNKDGVITFLDISEMRSHLGAQLSNITVMAPVAALPEKMSHLEVSSQQPEDRPSLTENPEETEKKLLQLPVEAPSLNEQSPELPLLMEVTEVAVLVEYQPLDLDPVEADPVEVVAVDPVAVDPVAVDPVAVDPVAVEQLPPVEFEVTVSLAEPTAGLDSMLPWAEPVADFEPVADWEPSGAESNENLLVSDPVPDLQFPLSDKNADAAMELDRVPEKSSQTTDAVGSEDLIQVEAKNSDLEILDSSIDEYLPSEPNLEPKLVAETADISIGELLEELEWELEF
jgi:hypothetical protein